MDRNATHTVVMRMSRRERLAFGSLVGFVGVSALALFLESTRSAYGGYQYPFRAVAHWFDPVFFQYSLLLLVLAVLIVPFVTLSYIKTMTGRKDRRLYSEIPEAHRDEIRERLRSRSSFNAYLGSVLLTTAVVLLGASIILIFKPVPSEQWPGVDFSLGANSLMMGPFIELFGSNPCVYYVHLMRSLTAFQFGFLGAYIYFIGSLARAYFTLDLTPQTFVDGSIRMISASVLALVVSFAPGIHGSVNAAAAAVCAAIAHNAPAADSRVAAHNENPSEASEDNASGQSTPSKPTSSKVGEHSEPAWNLGLLPIISFVFGFFPSRALLAMQRMTLSAVRSFGDPDKYRALPLSMLAGMSYSHEVRLEREGFDNIENFSNADPVSLALRTGFGYEQLRQWVSEAWLATHLRDDYAEFVRSTGITSRDELQHVFVHGGENAVGELANGSRDAESRRRMGVKLAALRTMLLA